MKRLQGALGAAADAVLASFIAALLHAGASASAGAWDAVGLPHVLPIAAAEDWFALAPIALVVTLGLAAALAVLRGMRALRRIAWVAAAGALLAPLAAFHDAAIEALQRIAPPLGDPLARAAALVSTQPKGAVLLAAGAAAAFGLLRAARGGGGLRLRESVVLIAFAGAALGLHLARTQLPQPRAKSVLLVVLDTVSARHLASGGYARDTMPELEALAGRGVRFPNAFSAAPWTVPSHASMFSGLAPIAHGATQEHTKLSDGVPTLAEILRNEGFRTFAAAGNTVVGPYSQLDQGFAQFLPTWRRDVVAATRGPAHPNNTAFERFLASVPRGERFFAFVNYIDAHSPYAPPPPHDRSYGTFPRRPVDPSWQHYYTGRSALGSLDFQELADLYDGELEQLSRDLAALIAELERSGRLSDTLVIVTADHGENLGDHEHLDHVFDLHDSLLHVPLFVLGGGTPGGVVDPRLATSVDVFATTLAAAGVEWARFRTEGRDLLAPAAPRAELTHEYYFPNQALSAIAPEDLARAHGRLAPFLRRLRALRGEDGWKLIWGSNGRHELYDLAADPDERVDRAAGEPERVAQMTRRLEARLAEQAGRPFRFADEPAPLESAGFEGLDEETRKNLESLGYVK
jgi:arylsulfatase A-like enzyme